MPIAGTNTSAMPSACRIRRCIRPPQKQEHTIQGAWCTVHGARCTVHGAPYSPYFDRAYYSAMQISRRNFLAAAAVPFVQGAASLPLPGPPGDPTPGRWRKLGLGDADRDGLMYVPRSFAKETAMPLLVLLHGAGNTALSTQYAYQYADEFNFIILSPDSRDERTWDAILGLWGPDLE